MIYDNQRKHILDHFDLEDKNSFKNKNLSRFFNKSFSFFWRSHTFSTLCTPYLEEENY